MTIISNRFKIDMYLAFHFPQLFSDIIRFYEWQFKKKKKIIIANRASKNDKFIHAGQFFFSCFSFLLLCFTNFRLYHIFFISYQMNYRVIFIDVSFFLLFHLLIVSSNKFLTISYKLFLRII